MKIVKIKAYKYAKLSYHAQQNAFNNWAQTQEYPWNDENVASIKAFYREFDGIVKSGREWDSCYNDELREHHTALEGVRAAKWLQRTLNHRLTTAKVYRKGEKVRKSRIFKVGNSCPWTGYCMDESILDPIRKFIARPTNETVLDVLQNAASSWAIACDKDAEYYWSEECFLEECKENDWFFTKDGKMI